MMFRLKAVFPGMSVKAAGERARRLALLLALALPGAFAGSGAAFAETPYAVVPKRIIYPGEELQAGQLEEIEVTNPNIAPGYVQRISAVAGLVTKKTLLPGRIILTSALREPFAVSRGSAVMLIFQNGPLRISANGTPLQDAAIGEVIRVRNRDSGVIVSGTVMADGTVQVMMK